MVLRRVDRGIGVKPLDGGRNTTRGRALQAHVAAGPAPFENNNVSPGNRLTASCAKTFIVDRVPRSEIIEIAKDIQLVFRRKP